MSTYGTEKYRPLGLPNLITFLRILLIPVFVIIFYLPVQGNHFIATFIFAIAAITDWLDGYLARSLGLVSRLGAFLDPVADKLIVVSALMLVVGEEKLPYLTIPALVIIGREIMVSALREWMSEVGKGKNIAVSYLGKIKTSAQMCALIFLLLYKPPNGLWFAIVGYILLWLAALLTLWSMSIYLKAAWEDLSA